MPAAPLPPLLSQSCANRPEARPILSNPSHYFFAISTLVRSSYHHAEMHWLAIGEMLVNIAGIAQPELLRWDDCSTVDFVSISKRGYT